MSKLIYKTKESILVFLPIIIVILATLAFLITITPTEASAQNSEGYDDGYDHFMYTSPNPIPILYSISPSSVRAGENITTITLTGHGFTPESVARWNGSSRATTFIDADHLMIHLNAGDLNASSKNYVNVFNPKRGAYSTAETFKISGFVAGASKTSTATNDSVQNVSKKDETASALASSAILGENSLIPSGLIQWVLFAVIALLIIIIVRKFLGASERYHESPLKHS